MKKLLSFIPVLLLTLNIYAVSPLEKGDKVPSFSAIDENGDAWELSDQHADYLVIYFYPAAFTGGCTKQACSYRDNDAAFKLLNAQVIGVSGDEYENLQKFKEFHNLNFTLLSDVDGKIAELFGVPTREGNTIEKEVDGKTLQLTRGVTTSRWTYVVDRNGKLVYKDEDVQAATDYEAVLKEIKTHNDRKTCQSR
ncbi:MAG: peroxiredoxin [Bacteroidales bacterium]|nr:peroxiredoxin [Bacteroidales bacterium]